MTMRSPTSLLSPASFLQTVDNMAPADRQSRANGQIPLQQPISSASQLPSSSSSFASFSHVASYKYVEQHRTFLEHQRELHNEERALWHLERQELHTRIQDLEASLRQFPARRSTELASPLGAPSFGMGNFGSFSTHGSRTTSGSTGDEFWRGAGGKSDSVPTRTFSESSDYSTTRSDERRMPSIAENQRVEEAVASPDSMSRETSHEQNEYRHKPSIDGAKIDKNLDGISFKTSGLASSIVKSVITPQSPSPLHTTSPPATSDSPSPSNLLAVVDLYTKDAGHTPLARLTSDSTSDQATPTVLEIETQKEPRPSVAVSRRPNERSDSYFPPPPETIDEDPELTGPLSLPTEAPEGESFLNELDSKLLQAAKSHTFSPNSEASDSARTRKENKAEGDDETEPKLRIKRSMNFGSAFGAKNCGKGI